MNVINAAISRRYFNRLVEKVQANGVKYPKDQGEWVILEYLPGNVFLLDTWGQVLSLYRMKDGFNYQYSIFCGVKEDNTLYKKYIGANLGAHSTEFNLQIDLELLTFYNLVLDLCLQGPRIKTPLDVGVRAAKMYLANLNKG
jgi:hypothetical protein